MYSCSQILEQLCRAERLQPFQTLKLSRQPTPSADTEVGPSPDFSVSIGATVTSRRLSNHLVLQTLYGVCCLPANRTSHMRRIHPRHCLSDVVDDFWCFTLTRFGMQCSLTYVFNQTLSCGIGIGIGIDKASLTLMKSSDTIPCTGSISVSVGTLGRFKRDRDRSGEAEFVSRRRWRQSRRMSVPVVH